ncbi:uncharacterized protein LOC122659342 [Telopea speciosissima]|uniref:uncharacterized protein LOC122659342 n=1 Tax=Telopea speciosissima TaxID=54955 RepID=UPI001CC67D0D|nr:uncharacterized protein LOC122659342 [Telopea speciosissima]
MLSAVSVDGNNCLFALALAIVEVENTATWEFFLYNLTDALQGSMDFMNLTFMTDKLKGLIHAISSIFPAQASSAWVYERAIEKMKDTNVEAHDWLLRNPPSTWSRHAFDTGAKCDHVTNNMIESFNSWIGPMRNKTILSLIDDIRENLMIRLWKKYIFAFSVEGKVTPSVKKKLKLIVSDARFCHAQFAGENQYEVTDGSTRFTVNLSTQHCDCGVWRISGIPYKHAAACIREQRREPEDFCDFYYSVDKLQLAYREIILSMPDLKQFTVNTSMLNGVLQPPKLKRQPGRPRRNRRREPGEPDRTEFRRKNQSVRCGHCK